MTRPMSAARSRPADARHRDPGRGAGAGRTPHAGARPAPGGRRAAVDRRRALAPSRARGPATPRPADAAEQHRPAHITGMQSAVSRCKMTATRSPNRHRHEHQGRPRRPTIQVLERSFALLDVLAEHHDPVSLKEISEQHRPAPVHRAPHPQRPDDRPLRRPPAGRQLPPGHAPAGTGQSGQGAAGRARRGAGPDARAAQADAPAGEPVDAPGRRDRLRRTHLQRTLGHAGGARHRRPRAAAPDLGRASSSWPTTTRRACAPTPRAPA